MSEIVEIVVTEVLSAVPGHVVVVVPETMTEVVEVAIQGPPGINHATYTHNQTTPSATWTAPHNMNRWPSVSVVDHLGNLVEPDVSYVNENIVQIAHGVPMTGKAFFN